MLMTHAAMLGAFCSEKAMRDIPANLLCIVPITYLDNALHRSLLDVHTEQLT